MPASRARRASSGPASASASTLTITTCLPCAQQASTCADAGRRIAGGVDDDLDLRARRSRRAASSVTHVTPLRTASANDARAACARPPSRCARERARARAGARSATATIWMPGGAMRLARGTSSRTCRRRSTRRAAAGSRPHASEASGAGSYAEVSVQQRRRAAEGPPAVRLTTTPITRPLAPARSMRASTCANCTAASSSASCSAIARRSAFVHLLLGLARGVEGHAGAGGDQAADDDVLLQAAQLVALAHDRRLGQHARRLLERRRRDEESVDSDALVMPSSTSCMRRRHLAFGAQLVVGVEQLGALDLLAGDVAGCRPGWRSARGAASGARSLRCACR